MKFASRKPIILIIIGILLFILLRTPSLFEPHWYSDEGIYAAVAQEISLGETLYEDIWDNKPHLIYLVYILAGNNNRLFFIRLFNLIAGLGTVIGIYKLTGRIFNRKLAFIAYFLAILTLGLPTFEGNIANGENFFLPFTVWGLYLGIDSISRRRKQLFAGFLFGIATLFKIIASFDFLALVIYLIATETRLFTKRPKLKEFSKIGFLLLGFCIPIFIIGTKEIIDNNFTNFIQTTLFDMFAYVQQESTENVFIKISTSMRILLLLISNLIVILNYYHKKLTKISLFVILVIVYEYFATIVSERHFMHYLLQLIPGFSLIVAFVIGKIQQQKLLVSKINIAITLLLGIYFALLNFTKGQGLKTPYAAGQFQGKGPYHKIYAYYKNFGDYYLRDKITKDEYNNFFNSEESKLITLRKTINTHYKNISKERIYIHSDQGWTYPFLQVRIPSQFSVAYHIYLKENGEEILIKDLGNNPPKLIIIDKTTPTFHSLDQLLDSSYVLTFEDNDYRYYLLDK